MVEYVDIEIANKGTSYLKHYFYDPNYADIQTGVQEVAVKWDPDPPTSPTITDALCRATEDSVFLSWVLGEDDNSGLKETRVYRNDLNDFETAKIISCVQSPNDNYSDNSKAYFDSSVAPLVAGKTYYYFLTSVDVAGNESDPDSIQLTLPKLGFGSFVNFFDNSSFERAVSSFPERWTGTAEYLTAGGCHGDSYVKVNSSLTIISHEIFVLEGEDYVISAYAMGASGLLQITASFYDDNRSLVSGDPYSFPTISASWARIEKTFTAPAGAKYCTITFYASTSTKISVDAVQFELGTTASEYYETRAMTANRLIAGEIKAQHIDVADLSALQATIGNFDIEENQITSQTDGAGLIIDSETPKIALNDGTRERVAMGKSGDDWGFRATDADGNVVFEAGFDTDTPYMYAYADSHDIELELMKMSFQHVSWAQFAVFDALDDESKRLDPDPSTYPAVVDKSELTNGGDDTASRLFGFVSKIYEDITTIEGGTSTSVGTNFLTDTSKNWFTDEVRNLTLVDSSSNEFNIDSCTSDTLTVAGTPAAGVYHLKDDNPQYMLAFCTFLDSTNGGYGYVKMEVSFDNRANWMTILDTESSIDRTQGTVQIANSGTDYAVRLTLKNDASGNGAKVYRFLVATDPSPWRF